MSALGEMAIARSDALPVQIVSDVSVACPRAICLHESFAMVLSAAAAGRGNGGDDRSARAKKTMARKIAAVDIN